MHDKQTITEQIVKHFQHHGLVELSHFLLDLSSYIGQPISLTKLLRRKFFKTYRAICEDDESYIYRKGYNQPKLIHPSLAYRIVAEYAPDLAIIIWNEINSLD